MNFIDNINIQTEQEKVSPTYNIKEERIISAKKDIAEIMKQARFPKNHKQYSSSFDDGNHPNGDTEIQETTKEMKQKRIIITMLNNILSHMEEYIGKIELHNFSDADAKEMIDILEVYRKNLTSRCSKINPNNNNTIYSNVLHSTKNIINGINWFWELLLDEEANREEKEEYKNIILWCIKQAKTFIITFSHAIIRGTKVESGYIKTLLTTLVPYYKNICINNHINFSHFIEEDSLVDNFVFSSVINDLLTNAIKFTPEWGRIHLSIKIQHTHNTKHMEISVHNTGSYIPPERDPLNDGISTQWTRKEKWTGIWLKGTQNLLKIYEEDIRRESDKIKWTTFTFSLPYSETQNK